MKQLSGLAAITLAIATAACSNSNDNSGGSPTSPTPPNPSLTVRAVVVTGAPASNTTYQMNAKANMSDGSSIDVTAQAQWATSSPEIATIAPGGLLTVKQSGQIDVRATYQTTTGSMPLTVTAPGSGMFILSGSVHEPPPGSKPVAGVTVRITAGTDAGTSTTTAADGTFGFTRVHGGQISLEAVKDGYQTAQYPGLVLDHDREIEIVMYPNPPINSAGVKATARCNDASWSWASTKPEACTANGGVAYVVCPGPMCDMPTQR